MLSHLRNILAITVVLFIVAPAQAQQEVAPIEQKMVPNLVLPIPIPTRPSGIQALSINDILALGIAQNPQMRIAAEQVEQARATYLQQKSVKAPRLFLNNTTTLTPEKSINTSPLLTRRFPDFPERFVLNGVATDQFALSLEVLLTSFGKVENTIAAAFLQIDVQMANADVQQLDLSYQVKKAAFEKLKADSTVEVARLNLAVTNQNMSDTQALFQQGVMSRYDILQAEIEVTRAIGNLAQNLTNVDVASANLGTVLAERRYYVQPLPPPPIEVAPEIELPDLENFALEHRPEMRSLNFSRSVAQKLIDAAYGENQPTVTLAANYQTAFGQSLAPVDVPSLTLQIQWQIFDGGFRKAKIQEAESVLRSINASQEQLEYQILLEVQQNWSELSQTAFNLRTAEKQLANTIEYYDMARRRYLNGLATTLEVSNSLRDLIDARAQLVETLYNRDLAFARLEQALGHDVPERHLNLDYLTGADRAQETTP